MSLDRRTFVHRMGLGALGALAAAGPLSALPAPVAPAPALPAYDPAHPDEYWRAVRAQYPLRDDPLYLNTGGLGPTPQRVLDRVYGTMTEMQEHSEPEHERRIKPARRALASFLGARPDEVCFTRNTTEGNSIVAAGLALNPGDEVIFETHAHPGGSYPWFNQVQRHGVVVKLFEPDVTSAEANVARIAALITPRTKVIQVSHIVCTTGLVLPVRAIADLAHQHGAWFHVDGAQAVGMIPVDVGALGCDSYAFSGHKWLGGPHETGGFFIRRDRLEQVAPVEIGSYSGDLPFLPGVIKLEDSAVRHEYGTRNLGLIAGLAEAIRFQLELGRDRIAAWSRGLATGLAAGIEDIPGLTVLSPRDPVLRSAMVTFSLRHVTAGRLTRYLGKRHRLRTRPVTEQGLQAVRVSTHVFNSRADCDRVIAALRAAAHDL
ncbi:MAG: aminotransferase class V-fold PLP-dependent enzyme [Verrucomicrobia bacterium]|nr:aminotransferase class V-fold PLP-dependent enzyme [Verrucomicrobiota bacterium]